jgi:hypothetical protein
MFKNYFYFFLITLVVSACSNEAETEELKPKRIFPDYPVYMDSIVKMHDGIIHGIELGDNIKKIKTSESAKLTEEDDQFIYYEYKIDSLSSYSIGYTFSADSLEEIEILINCKSIDISTEQIKNLKKYYQLKYTAPLMDKGIYVFNCFDSKKKNFKISLSDNSTSESGIINLLVYREK